jgi:hypothetical protein
MGRIRALHLGGGRPEIRRLLDRPAEAMEPSDGAIVAGDPLPWVAP